MSGSQNLKTGLYPFKFEERPDIDGLRAVSVLLVVIFHVPIGLFMHGSIGVQIFFLMSGYLITAVILRDLTRGKFNLRGFYERRLKRIFPIMLICCFTNFLIAASYRLYELQDISKPALFSLTLMKNYQKKFGVVVDYEGHYWTLAIEKQFYLVWPLLVPCLLPQSFKKQMIILAATIAISFPFSISNVRQQIDISTLGSLWNLMLGCAITFFQYEQQKQQSRTIPKSNVVFDADTTVQVLQEKAKSQVKEEQPPNTFYKILKNILTAIALLMLFMIAQFKKDWVKPDLDWVINALGAICGLVLLVIKDTFVQDILSFRVLRFIGRQSYWIYLWHFPYIMLVDRIQSTWLKVFYLLIAVLSGACEDKIANAKSKAVVYCILGSYIAMFSMFMTFFLAS